MSGINIRFLPFYLTMNEVCIILLGSLFIQTKEKHEQIKKVLKNFFIPQQKMKMCIKINKICSRIRYFLERKNLSQFSTS